MAKFICIIGPDESYNGGILNVIHQILNSGTDLKNVKKIHIGTASRKNKIKVFISGIKKFINLCKKNKVLIAHIHLSERGSLYRTIVLLKICKKYRIKSIVHSHGGLFFDHIKSMNPFIKKNIFKYLNYADRVIVLTEGWKHIWSEIVSASKIRILPNGTSVPKMDRKEFFFEKKYNLLFLGNINPIKGIYDLIDAVKLIDTSKIPVVLRIAGGDQVNECKKYVEKCGLDNIIRVIGWVEGNKKEELMSISDVLILPSYYESFGMVAIEALAHGIPVICGDRGFTKEVIVDGKNGRVCRTGDKKDIAMKIQDLYNVKTLKIYSENGYIYVKDNYEISVVMKQLNQIYKELI